jgi:meso-butanediol dehydrogenase / (S,S)-butanediol dehydrogenase / diacetyl reductase
MSSVLVTGASRGIGKAIALRLARDGFNIGIGDTKSQSAAGHAVVREINELGKRSAFVEMDVSAKDQVENAVDITSKMLGPFKGIVNNAGIHRFKTVLESTPDDFDKIFTVNVAGVLYGIQAAARKFAEEGQKDGRIVNACSVSGFRGHPMEGLYCGTKFAVRALTQTCATELGPLGVRINSFAPGPVATVMWKEIDLEAARRTGTSAGSHTHAIESETALGRKAYPEDIAGLTSFLFSKDSSFISGQCIIIDGGRIFS